MDCFNCQKADCDNDTVTIADVKRQNALDRAITRENNADGAEPEIQKRREAQRRYAKSEKGKERARQYIKSDRGKAAQKRYEQSEKGREVRKRVSRENMQKRIANGKNAEACRAYYYRRKQRLQAEKEAAEL
jgi:hypothetical protein